MHAFRAWILKFSLLLLCVLLTACDRHNDISNPAPLPDDEEIVCEYATDPPLESDYVNNVMIHDAYEDAQFLTKFDYDADLFDYEIITSFLVNKAHIEVDEIVASEHSEVLASFAIDINGISVEIDDAFVEFPLVVEGEEGEDVQCEDGEDGEEGNNCIKLNVSAQRVEVLQTVNEEVCGYPSQQEIDEANARDEPLPIPTRTVNDSFNYTFSVTRQSLDVMKHNEQLLNLASIDSSNAYDNFGNQVLMGKIIIDTNGTARDVMVIGAPLEDSNARGIFQAPLTSEAQDNSATDSGAVFIYERYTQQGAQQGDWVLTHYLKASNADAGDRFGSTLALHDNLLVVTALGEDSSAAGINGPMDNNLASESGAVYVFEFDLQNWHQTNFIKTPVNSVGIDGFDDDFGFALSFESGLLLVSAPREDSANGEGSDVSRPNSGAVYLYEVNEGVDDFRTFDYKASFKALNMNQNDYFGSSLSMSPSGTRFVVGATGEDSNYRDVLELPVDSSSPNIEFINNNSAVDSGAVYMFYRNGSIWSDGDVFIKSENSDPGDHFGASVRFLGNDTLLVGAPLEDGNGDGFNRDPSNNSAPNSGAAYVYTINTTNTSIDDDVWQQRYYIKAPLSESDEHFGSALTSFEDRFVIAAPNTQDSGQVYGYVFDQSKALNEKLKYFMTLSTENPSENMRYGSSISIFGSTLVVGAPGYEGSEVGLLEQAGGVFVYQ